MKAMTGQRAQRGILRLLPCASEERSAPACSGTGRRIVSAFAEKNKSARRREDVAGESRGRCCRSERPDVNEPDHVGGGEALAVGRERDGVDPVLELPAARLAQLLDHLAAG